MRLLFKISVDSRSHESTTWLWNFLCCCELQNTGVALLFPCWPLSQCEQCGPSCSMTTKNADEDLKSQICPLTAEIQYVAHCRAHISVLIYCVAFFYMHSCLLPSVVDHTSCNENVWIPQKSQQWSPFDNLGQNTNFTETQVTWWIVCGKIGLSILMLILKSHNGPFLLSMPFLVSYAIQNNIWRNLTGLLRTSSVKTTFSTLKNLSNLTVNSVLNYIAS